MNDKKKKLVISDKVWLLISFLVALAVWYVLSVGYIMIYYHELIFFYQY